MASKSKSYQQLRSELDEIVASLQQDGGEDIDATISLYERGQILVKELESYLKTADIKIKKLSAKTK